MEPPGKILLSKCLFYYGNVSTAVAVKCLTAVVCLATVSPMFNGSGMPSHTDLHRIIREDRKQELH